MKQSQPQAKYLEPSHQKKRETTRKLFDEACQAVLKAGKEMTMKSVIEESKKIRGSPIHPSTFSRNQEIKTAWDNITGKKYDRYDFRKVNLKNMRPSKNILYNFNVFKKWTVEKLAAYLTVMLNEWYQTKKLNDALNIRIIELEEELAKLKYENNPK